MCMYIYMWLCYVYYINSDIILYEAMGWCYVYEDAVCMFVFMLRLSYSIISYFFSTNILVLNDGFREYPPILSHHNYSLSLSLAYTCTTIAPTSPHPPTHTHTHRSVSPHLFQRVTGKKQKKDAVSQLRSTHDKSLRQQQKRVKRTYNSHPFPSSVSLPGHTHTITRSDDNNKEWNAYIPHPFPSPSVS